MFVSVVGMVEVWQRAQAGEQRPWMAAERVEVEAVSAYGQDIDKEGRYETECNMAGGK